MEFINNWYRTAKAVIFHPKEFFKSMPTKGGIEEPLKFAVINVFIASVFYCAFRLLFFPSDFYSLTTMLGEAPEKSFVLYIHLCSYFFFGIMKLFILPAVYHLLLKLVGSRKNYEATFRVVAYLSVFSIATPIIFTGTPAGGLLVFLIYLYVLYIMIHGFKEVHKITLLRSALAMLPFIVIAIIVVLILAFYALALIWVHGIEQSMTANIKSHIDPNNLPMQAKVIAGLLK